MVVYMYVPIILKVMYILVCSLINTGNQCNGIVSKIGHITRHDHQNTWLHGSPIYLLSTHNTSPPQHTKSPSDFCIALVHMSACIVNRIKNQSCNICSKALVSHYIQAGQEIPSHVRDSIHPGRGSSILG